MMKNEDLSEEEQKQLQKMTFAPGVPVDGFYQKAFINMLLGPGHPSGSSIGVVTMEPGAHNNWHTHYGWQILMVTDGEGFYQEKGKKAKHLKKGDVVVVQPGVMHWHGAAPDHWFAHIAAVVGNDGYTNVGEPLPKDEYEKACREE
ncbi:MAG: cupin domain-containing protein [Lachnospiraceae bacterium]|jgi:quercetin dioxygenase-like cupin family protein